MRKTWRCGECNHLNPISAGRCQGCGCKQPLDCVEMIPGRLVGAGIEKESAFRKGVYVPGSNDDHWELYASDERLITE